MKPREFLNFFKTNSGKLVLFAAIFGGGLILFSALHDRSRHHDELDPPETRTGTNQTDKPQVVQTLERPNQPYYAPALKAEASQSQPT